MKVIGISTNKLVEFPKGITDLSISHTLLDGPNESVEILQGSEEAIDSIINQCYEARKEEIGITIRLDANIVKIFK